MAFELYNKNLTVETPKLQNPSISQGATVTDGGLTVTAGGMTVTAGGRIVTADGAEVTAGDIEVTDGDVIIGSATKGLVHSGTGTITQGTSGITGVTLNATSGVITTFAATLATNTEIEFTLTNSAIVATSVILVSMQDENTQAASALIVSTNTVGAGSVKIKQFNGGSGTASATANKIHFLIINAG